MALTEAKGHRPLRRWTSQEKQTVRENYGIKASARELSELLGRSIPQIYYQVRRLGLAHLPRTCVVCKKVFTPSGQGRYAMCSDSCRKRKVAWWHNRYAKMNQVHLREYAKAYKLRVWGESSPEVGLRGELVALEKILPPLGFSDIFHASRAYRSSPFDFIATFEGRRTLVDVTTCNSKSGAPYKKRKQFAKALGMSLFVLFVRPNMSGFVLKVATEKDTVSCNQKELVKLGK